MYKIFTRKEKVNSQLHQLHHKQECCALPRKQLLDHALSGGGTLATAPGTAKGHGQTSQHSKVKPTSLLFGKTPIG